MPHHIRKCTNNLYDYATYVNLMYELKNLESYLRVNLLGPGPRLIKKKNYRAAVSQRLRNTKVDDSNKHIIEETVRRCLPTRKSVHCTHFFSKFPSCFAHFSHHSNNLEILLLQNYVSTTRSQ